MGKTLLIIAVALFAVLVVCVGFIVQDCRAPYVEITADQAPQCVDGKVQLLLTVDQYLNDNIKLDFFIPLYIDDGIVLMLPIFEHFDVYSSKEGIYIAVEKGVELDGKYLFGGHVREDNDQFVIVVDWGHRP